MKKQPQGIDAQLTQKIEGGPNFGPSSLDKATDALDRNYGVARYTALHNIFGARGDGRDSFADWDVANVEEVLRCTIGPAEDFVSDYDQMTDGEREENFPDPGVAELARMWADSGRPQSN